MLVMGFVVGKHFFGASDQAEHEPVFSTIHASVHSLPVKIQFDSKIMDIGSRRNNMQLRRIVSDMCRCLHMLTSGFLTTSFFIYFKACPKLSNPCEGSVSTPNGTEFEDEAIYECKRGFELVGNSRRYCRSTGSWSGTAPTCKQIGRSLLKEKSERIDKKSAKFCSVSIYICSCQNSNKEEHYCEATP